MPDIKHKNQRVAVFIDAQNLYHSARSLFGGRVNFKNLLATAVGGRQLIRAFSYVISTKTGEEKPFFEALIKLGIETREKELQEFFGGAGVFFMRAVLLHYFLFVFGFKHTPSYYHKT